jgi:hypothetical protein
MKDWRTSKGPVPPEELKRILAELAAKRARKQSRRAWGSHTPETRAKIGASRKAASGPPKPSAEDNAKHIAATRAMLGASQAR